MSLLDNKLRITKFRKPNTCEVTKA